MPPPSNQTCATAVEITTTPFTVTVNTTEAGDSPSSPDSACGSGNSYNSIWYRWTCPAGLTQASIIIDDAETHEGLFTVFSGECGSLSYEGTCDFAPFEIPFAVSPGTTYFFMLTTFDPGGVEAFTFTFNIPAPAGDFCAELSFDNSPTCDTGLWTIRGSGFQVGASIDLRDPNGAPAPFTLVSFSATEIVVHLDVILPGTYCVTITNPAAFT